MNIDIKINDNRKFTEVAFLVDREDFRKDIVEIRKRLKILTIPYTLPQFQYETANNVARYYVKGVCTIYDVIETLKDICNKEHTCLSKLEYTLTTSLMYSEVLLKKYNKNRLYLPVVLASLLTGKIQEEDFSSSLILTIDKKTAQQILDDLEDNETITTIQVNRESTWNEVKDVFTSIQKYHFGTKKTDENDSLMRLFKDEIPDDKLPDTISNIKRDREWYWLKKEGWSYQKIKNHYLKMGGNITLRGIELAIKRYSNNLE